MESFFSKIKEHPYITAGIALVGGIILYTAFFGGSSSGGAPSQAQLDAANFTTQTQGATQLAVAQAAQQAAQYQAQLAAGVADTKIASDVSLAQLQAQTIQNGQQLQAGVQQSLIAGSLQENLATIAAGTQTTTLNAQVAEAKIAADQAVAQSGQNYGFQFATQALADASNAPHPTTFTSDFGNYNTGGTYTPPPAPAPAPAPPAAPAPAPTGIVSNILYGTGSGGVYVEPGMGGLASAPFPVANGSTVPVFSAPVAPPPPPPPSFVTAPAVTAPPALAPAYQPGSTGWFGDMSPAALALANYMETGGSASSAPTVAAESGPYDPFIATHLPGYDTTFATLYNSAQVQAADRSAGPLN